MSSSSSQSLSKFHSLFNNENKCAETETKLDFISSICDYDHIHPVDENNWQCLWCNTIFQGINATKALARILGKRGVYIESFYSSINKTHITRYQDLQHFKAAWKGVIHNYSEISNHPFRVYRISRLLSSNPTYTAVTKVSLHQMTLMYLKCQPSALHQI